MRATQKKLPKVATMADKTIPREELTKLRNRAGLSLDKVAKHLGYASPSGVARYEQEKTQGSRKIPHDFVKRLIPLFRGAGNPPIQVEELLAISDIDEGVQLPKVAAFAMASVVDAGSGGLLVVRYKIEDGTFIQLAGSRNFGSSRIGVSSSFPPESQFVAVVNTATQRWSAGTQLHCVSVDQVNEDAAAGLAVIVACPYKGGELVELKTGNIGPTAATKTGLFGDDKYPMDGKVIAYIVGHYETLIGR